jgi:hypothetical protein
VKEVPWRFKRIFYPGEETPFKQEVVRHLREKFPLGKVFRIETEETERGFPDLLLLHKGEYRLIETKVSDKKGVIDFTPAQPLFYRRHRELELSVLAWDVPGGRCVELVPEDMEALDGLRLALPGR